ncbi:metallophosphoesterase family protein [Rhizobium sp. CNPSo 4062]|uniref:metallophosphoesterase family protein n=1 Tax=Rhizobium sp. CNPSo 4062 TaxID=3021410 RepID=UPI00254C31DE|nr:metallophosphoesterase family protein [Rhizobium sp. CNPSo 4062]MDK4703887.1 metallophosphoesterase family protein [Rhizobium sp. CNPSo 4062]
MSKTYVIADIHGRYDLLQAALERIENNPSGGTIVFLGDYVDRGPDSKSVLDRLMEGPGGAHWRWVCLKGNHEDMMVAALRGEVDLAWWLGNGGQQTLSSFDMRVPDEYLAWADALPQYHADGNRIFAHAGVDPTKPLSEQTEAMLLWSRCSKYHDIAHHDGYLVHGHTPFEDGPVVLEGRCNLDTGAVWTGSLAVAVFDDQVPGKPERIFTITR